MAIAAPFLAFALGSWYGRRRCDQELRDEYSEQYRVAMAAHRLREYHRLNAEHKAFYKVGLTPRPFLDGEIVKVGMN
jgi:hypothetical protein